MIVASGLIGAAHFLRGDAGGDESSTRSAPITQSGEDIVDENESALSRLMKNGNGDTSSEESSLGALMGRAAGSEPSAEEAEEVSSNSAVYEFSLAETFPSGSGSIEVVEESSSGRGGGLVARLNFYNLDSNPTLALTAVYPDGHMQFEASTRLGDEDDIEIRISKVRDDDQNRDRYVLIIFQGGGIMFTRDLRRSFAPANLTFSVIE